MLIFPAIPTLQNVESMRPLKMCHLQISKGRKLTTEVEASYSHISLETRRETLLLNFSSEILSNCSSWNNLPTPLHPITHRSVSSIAALRVSRWVSQGSRLHSQTPKAFDTVAPRHLERGDDTGHAAKNQPM